MRRRGIGCLPIVERDRLVGLVTVSQLLGVLERALAQ
jgi:CBS domain-containing protein